MPVLGRSALKITAIQTGTANCHVRQIASPQNIGAIRRKAGIMLDQRWTGPLPINAYLIEHSDGLLLVDTGDSWRNSERGYLPRLNPFFKYAVQIRVAPAQEVGAQLKAMGIESRDIQRVLLTHLHHDHTGGLNHFPHSQVLASRDCMIAARRKRGLIGAVPSTWPTWFDPEPYAFTGPAIGPFQRSAPLTRDGSIVVVETPGHMTGHVTILARAENLTYALAGDLTYRQELLVADEVDGVTEHPAVSLASQQAIKQLARSEPLVLLPAHDPNATARLANAETLHPALSIAA